MTSVTHQMRRWRALQGTLARRAVCSGTVSPADLTCVAGVDCAFSADGGSIIAAAVTYDLRSQRVVEEAGVRRRLTAPYIPGFLSFREGPAVRAALRKLKGPWQAVLIDGQGLAHPRRCGLATHIGVQLGVIAIGVAKSLLIGRHDELPASAGSMRPLRHDGQTVGMALRTRGGVRPVYVSVGHGIDLPAACAVVMRCCRGFRLPEPTRAADQLAGRLKMAKWGSRGR